MISLFPRNESRVQLGLLTKHSFLQFLRINGDFTIILSPHLRHLSSQYDQFHKQVRQEVL